MLQVGGRSTEIRYKAGWGLLGFPTRCGAEAARILALNLAQYQEKFGELPAQEYMGLSSAETLTPETATTMADGMEHLVSLLASLTGDETPYDSVHWRFVNRVF